MLSYEKIKGYYDGGYWTKEQVAKAVDYGKITQEQYYQIVGPEVEPIEEVTA